MQVPIVEPAPIVMEHTQVFRDLFENRKQFRHFQNYLTGLLVLDNKSMANMCRCILDSADKTNLSRFFSEAMWFQEKVNTRRIDYMVQQTDWCRAPASGSCLILDDTLCERVSMSAVCLSTLIAITTIVTAPILWPITWSPVIT